MSFSATALVGFHAVPDVVVVVDVAAVVEAVFFDEPVVLAVDFAEGPFGAFVVVFVVLGELDLAFPCGAASTLSARAVAATSAAGTAIHLVIAPPANGRAMAVPCSGVVREHASF